MPPSSRSAIDAGIALRDVHVAEALPARTHRAQELARYRGVASGELRHADVPVRHPEERRATVDLDPLAAVRQRRVGALPRKIVLAERRRLDVAHRDRRPPRWTATRPRAHAAMRIRAARRACARARSRSITSSVTRGGASASTASINARPMPRRRADAITPMPPIHASSPRTARFASPTASSPSNATRDRSGSMSQRSTTVSSAAASRWTGTKYPSYPRVNRSARNAQSNDDARSSFTPRAPGRSPPRRTAAGRRALPRRRPASPAGRARRRSRRRHPPSRSRRALSARRR